jgi:hypothetical protein
MSTGSGVFLLASTDAEGVLFRRATGLPYDTLGVLYASMVYLVQCATGKTPQWQVDSPCTASAWTAWLTTAPCLRVAYWIPSDNHHRPFLARFVATNCLSTPSTWTGWSSAQLGGLLDAPLPPPIALPPTPISPWEQLSTSPPGVTEQVNAWVHALDHGVPPLVDLNALLALLDLPVRSGETSVAATLLIIPPSAPRTLSIPEATTTVPLWNPCLDGFSYTEVEQLSVLLHAPEYLHNNLYDKLRQECQKKLSSLTKRWPMHS